MDHSSNLAHCPPNDGGTALTSSETTGEILAILSKETGIEPGLLTENATIHELGIQSIDLVQAIFAIETRFDIEIPVGMEGEGGTITVGDFVRHVAARIDQNPTGAD